jgi:enoyl-CoA hydratase
MTMDFEVGQTAGREFEFTEERVKSFADLVGDHAPVHGDPAFAQRQGFEQRIVHGLFLGSIFSGLLGEELPGPRSVINTVSLKYHQPVAIGQTVRYEVSVKRVSEAVGAVVLELKARRPDGETCVSGSATCSLPTGS